MEIINATQNNLKNVSLTIPENKFIAVTGLSGSGKSTLISEVLGNEGYRHFITSIPELNQFFNSTIPNAEVENIRQLPPVVKLNQVKSFHSPQSTFGTLSDIYAISRVLFARFSSNEILSKSLFSFNTAMGACSNCKGTGLNEIIDLQKLVVDESLSLSEGALAPTLPNGYIMYSQVTLEELNKVCKAHGFSVDIPWKDLNQEQKDVILYGSNQIKVFYGKHSLESRLKWKDLKAKPREEGYYKGMLPTMRDILKRDRNQNILKYVSTQTCSSCEGKRLNKTALSFKWNQKNIWEWSNLTLTQLLQELNQLDLTNAEKKLVELIKLKLHDLVQLGMGHYSLNTPSEQISVGDAHRIKLINQLNTQLSGILFILDEPSIGLSPNYTSHLLRIIQRLRDNGNTVMVIEHDKEIIQQADWIVDIGPGAGTKGGQIMFNGPIQDFLKLKNNPTVQSFKEEKAITYTNTPIHFEKHQLYVLHKNHGADIDTIKKTLDEVLIVSDSPIGKTNRSNPATYIGISDLIRDIFAKSEDAKRLGLSKSHFSFNTKEGRCSTCEGAGVITLSLSVMGQINQTCPTCLGKRFSQTVNSIRWKNLSVSEIYELTVQEAISVFASEKKVLATLLLLEKLGLSYLKLGQASNTLSGGEAQRIKLTKHLSSASVKNKWIWLIEPSIGLHAVNVQQLANALKDIKHQVQGIVCEDYHPLLSQQADGVFQLGKEETSKAFKVSTAKEIPTKMILKGVSTKNLKSVNLEIPYGKITCVTGVSGSGKSALVTDTIYRYGQEEIFKLLPSFQQGKINLHSNYTLEETSGITPTIYIKQNNHVLQNNSNVATLTGIDKSLRFIFSRKAQSTGLTLSASHFSNQHELGKCPSCNGRGFILQPNESEITASSDLSVLSGAFNHNKFLKYYGNPEGQFIAILKEVATHEGIDLSIPFNDLSEKHKNIILNGTGEQVWSTTWKFTTKTRSGEQKLELPWKGMLNYVSEEYEKRKHNKNISELLNLFEEVNCEKCNGSGINADRLVIKVNKKSLDEVLKMDFQSIQQWLFDVYEDEALIQLLKDQLIDTLSLSKELNLSHLYLNRKSNTLSSGETQRIQLIKQLNSPLKNLTYILDYPSSGIDENNTSSLVKIINQLKEKGNHVIVIDNHKEVLTNSDYIIEMGPKAGKNGGNILYIGNVQGYLRRTETDNYFTSDIPKIKQTPSTSNIVINDLDRFTLQKDQIKIPVGGITGIYGPSGIGKSTLLKTIYESFENGISHNKNRITFPKEYSCVKYLNFERLSSAPQIRIIDYLDLLPQVSKYFAKNTDLKASHFSYKTKQGQCPECKGTGNQHLSLDVVANSDNNCSACNGILFNPDSLSRNINDMNIYEFMNCTVGELYERIQSNLKGKSQIVFEVLSSLNLSHLNLLQPLSSLSSGEKLRIQLVEMMNDTSENQLILLDEPSISSHIKDIQNLMSVFSSLALKNDLIIADHHPYVLHQADYTLGL